MAELLVFFLAVLVMFVPAINAYKRKCVQRHVIMVLNVLTGWTVVGWVILIIWSAAGKVEA